MNINATLIGQSVAFIVFMWFCMKYVWPPIMQALEDRKKKIASGLIFADEAEKKLLQAKQEAEACVQEAQGQAQVIINKANQRATLMINEATQRAEKEIVRLKLSAQKDIEQEVVRARKILSQQVASLAVLGATRLIGKYMDANIDGKIVEHLAAEL